MIMSETLTIQEYNEIFQFNSTQVIIQRISNLPKAVDILNKIKNFHVMISRNGMSTEQSKTDSIFNFMKSNNNNEYIFHNIFRDPRIFGIVCELIPPKTLKNMRISRLYIGSRGTGSHIHNHSVAINYLLYGRKQWIVFPNTSKNSRFLSENKMLYGDINENPLDWFESHISMLQENIEDLHIFVQESGTVVNVPARFYHGVYNLEATVGITYSWY